MARRQAPSVSLERRASAREAWEEATSGYEGPIPIQQRPARPSSPRGRGPAAGSPDRRAVELIRGVEVLIGKLADPELDLPLDLLGRFEKALHQGHTANLLRLSVLEQDLLGIPETDEARW